MNNDTLGALMFIVFVIAFVVVMAHIGRQHYKRTRWSDHYFGNLVTNRRSDIIAALESGRKDIKWLDRRRMQLMASADLGERWENLAKSPTLFVLDDNWDLIEEAK
jgi:hypothetical protein